MPPKGMTAFVQKNNATDATRSDASKGQPVFEDLLMDQPPRPKSAAARQKGQKPVQRHQQQHKQARSAAQSRDPSQNRGAIYETDASDADKTSTAHSERRASARQQYDTQKRQQDSQDEYSEESVDESDESEQLPKDPLAASDHPKFNGILNEKQRTIMGGLRDMHMKGDSYPSTTSGAPSHMEPSEQARPAVGQASDQQSHPPGLPQAGGQRQRLGAQASTVQHQQSPVSNHRQNHRAHQDSPAKAPLIVPMTRAGPIQAPVAGPLDTAAEARGSFVFGKAPPAHKSFGRPEKPMEQAMHSGLPNEHLQGVLPRPQQRPQPVQAHVAPNGRLSAPLKAAAGQQRSASPQVPQTQQHVKQAHRTSTPQDQIPQDDGSYHSEQDDQRRNVNDFDHEQGDVAMGEGPEFDHDYDELITMKYDDLRAESFDVDPKAQHFQLPDGGAADTLQGKLASMRRFDAHSQAAFFTALSIGEWEEAGDWFLEQFSQTVAKFKDARQEKRKAAKQFEDEIARRHEAVSKKRKVTEDALADMRQSGTQVLLGTPKKVKKHQ